MRRWTRIFENNENIDSFSEIARRNQRHSRHMMAHAEAHVRRAQRRNGADNRVCHSIERSTFDSLLQKKRRLGRENFIRSRLSEWIQHWMQIVKGLKESLFRALCLWNIVEYCGTLASRMTAVDYDEYYY